MALKNLLIVALATVALADDDLHGADSHLRHAPHAAPLIHPHGSPAPYHEPNPYHAPQPHHAPEYSPYHAQAHPGPYAPTYNAYAPAYGHPSPAPHGFPHGHKESSVHRNPYESHDAYDAIRTQDADLAPHNPYNNPYLAPHAAQHAQGQHGYTPYQYDMSKIPECAYTNKHYYNLTFCLQDDYYPSETIQYELERNKHLVERLLSDITYQSADNLVDGLTKAEEEGYTYEHYYGNQKHQQYGPDYKRAINTYGKWKVVVNLPDEYYAKGYGKGYEKYTQTQRLEQCMYPTAPCSYIDNKYYSQCLQKHNFVRLLAYTYEEGLHIDSFKLPVSCSCHIGDQHYGHGYGGHPVTPAYGGYHGYPSPTPTPHYG
ncbi:hypothetical protein TCAL_13247 [Tigriopus californicus]|uniref:Spaetzle domain-containing protein n=1 Tax=Tigriopus californicus TaxID=6832 RepID=A0A553PSG8_TIGCA|nr:hypothetical protein TCAL_13247 [Tigriopus californicus]|eukprot:TCALIF_13247-PA protein Name:"Protein of unknown function" AED:0.03 eAED:0.03 QI:52/0.87/0.77/1/0.87/0.66/9/136/371